MSEVDWSFWLWALPIMAVVGLGLWRSTRVLDWLMDTETPWWMAAVPGVLLAVLLVVNVNWRSTPSTTSTVIIRQPMLQSAPRPATTSVSQPPMRSEKRYSRDWPLLADCETGEHYTRPDGSWKIIRGTARWAHHDRVHQGGLSFAVSTWDRYRIVWLKDPTLPADAHLATQAQQIRVAEKVLELEGVTAWPRCSREIGWRR